MGWNMAVSLKEPTGYGIDVRWFGVVPGFLQQKDAKTKEVRAGEEGGDSQRRMEKW